MAHRPICARSNIFSLSKFSSVRTPHIGHSGALSENILRASEWVGRVTALTKHLMEGLFPPAVAGCHLPFEHTLDFLHCHCRYGTSAPRGQPESCVGVSIWTYIESGLRFGRVATYPAGSGGYNHPYAATVSHLVAHVRRTHRQKHACTREWSLRRSKDAIMDAWMSENVQVLS